MIEECFKHLNTKTNMFMEKRNFLWSVIDKLPPTPPSDFHVPDVFIMSPYANSDLHYDHFLDCRDRYFYNLLYMIINRGLWFEVLSILPTSIYSVLQVISDKATFFR